MMVGYIHDLTILGRMWHPGLQAVRSQSNVIVDNERNGHTSYLFRDQTDIFELPDEMEYIKEIDSGG